MRALFRSLSAAIVMSLATIGLSSAAGAVDQFGDVERDRWYATSVAWLVGEGITTGTSPGCFSPYDQVTRGQLVTFMFRLDGTLGNQPGANEHPFDDVIHDYQQASVGWAFAEGITTGTSASTFTPEAAITRGDFAVMLWRYAGEPTAAGPHPFTDVTLGYQQAAIDWMAETGITAGTTPTTFAPNGNMTRAQAASFLHRFMDEPATVTPAAATGTESNACIDEYESILVDAGLTDDEAVCIAPFITDLDIDTVVAVLAGLAPIDAQLIDILSDIIIAGCIPTTDRQAALIRAFL
ncbi:MAG: S-layer homology domain-containing protein [Actinomycetota bacterium]